MFAMQRIMPRPARHIAHGESAWRASAQGRERRQRHAIEAAGFEGLSHLLFHSDTPGLVDLPNKHRDSSLVPKDGQHLSRDAAALSSN
jgi:hypothetical protein